MLVAAFREDAEHHAAASRVLRELGESGDPWTILWPVSYEFLRVVTHPRVFNPPAPTQDAWQFLLDIAATPGFRRLAETPRHSEVFDKLVKSSDVRGNLIHDAHIAALIREHGISRFYTADEDFKRFDDLPLAHPYRR